MRTPTRHRRPHRISFGIRLLLALLLAPGLGAQSQPGWCEGFDEGRLDPVRWKATAEGDFKERTVDVADVGHGGPPDYRSDSGRTHGAPETTR